MRQQRSDLQQAVYTAIEAERQALTDAQKLASAPAIKAAEQAVADAEKSLSDLEQRLETLTENIQFPWMDSVKKEKASIRGRIGYQQTVVQNAKNELAQVVAESQVQYENAAVVARANQDSLVQFERKALEKFEQRLDKLRKQVQAPSAELAAAQKAADEQRARVATEEKKARDAAEKANKDQRELEQRRLSGLGLPGVKRVAGETVEIEAAKDAELTKALAEAYERSKQAQDAVAGVKQDIPQVPRATGPVARGVRTQVGKLSQARTPKQPEVETAVAEANVLAAEKAAKEPEKTTVEQRQEAVRQQQQMREAKERLENTTRAQLADVNIRIEAMERAIKPNPERIQELKDERAALQRQLVAARQDIEKEGELEKKTQRELKKEQRAQAKREAEDEFDAVTAPPTTKLTGKDLSYDGKPFDALPRDVQKVLYRTASYFVRAQAASPSKKMSQALERAKLSFQTFVDVYGGNPAYAGVVEENKRWLKTSADLDVSKIEFGAAPPAAKQAPSRKVSAPGRLTREQLEDVAKSKLQTPIDNESPLNGLTFAEAARYGAQRTTSPMVRQLFNKLAEVFDSAPVQDGSGRVYATVNTLNLGAQGYAAGIYTSKQDAVYFILSMVQVYEFAVVIHNDWNWTEELEYVASVAIILETPLTNTSN